MRLSETCPLDGAARLGSARHGTARHDASDATEWDAGCILGVTFRSIAERELQRERPWVKGRSYF